jgi:hypothetical protein
VQRHCSRGILRVTIEQSKINEDIPLYKGKAILRLDDLESEGDIELKYRFLSNHGTLFEFTGITTEQLMRIVNEGKTKVQIEVPFLNLTSDANIHNTNIGSLPELMGSLLKTNFKESEKQIDTLCFSVFNFPYVWSKQVKMTKTESFNILQFEDDEFEIEITPISNLFKVYKDLKKQQGHLITHRGVLKKRDGSLFKKEEAKITLEALGHTLSFSQGRYIDINFLTGLKEGNVLFQSFETHLCPPADNRVTWFDDMEPDSLNSVFSGMSKLVKHDVWKDEIGKALHWYYTSLSGMAMEISIVLNQTALELLIWCYFVEDKKIFSKTKFGPQSFYARLLEMFKLIDKPNIKFEPRNELDVFRANNLPDGDWLKAFAQVRNAIIHPDKKHKIENEDYRLKWNVREIGFQMIELIVLFLCEFKGKTKLSMDKPQMSGKVVEIDFSAIAEGGV